MIKYLIATAIIIEGCAQNNASTIKSLQAKCDSLSREISKCDSISNELFYVETELNRYEIAYKIFLERNPKAASQYGDIISDETE